MLVSDILNTVQTALSDDGVYRTDTNLLVGLNDGYKLLSLFTFFDERRTSETIDGTRNFNALPKDSTGECFAPLHVTNTATGARIHPCSVDDLEFYQSGWEGVVGTDAQNYVLLSPFHHAFSTIVLCPIQNTAETQLTLIGAYVPVDLTATDTPRLPEEYVDLLIEYVKFYAYSSEPGRYTNALTAYKNFLSRMEQFVVSLRARFPGGRDYEPRAIEFVYTRVLKSEQEEQKKTKEN